MFAPATLLDAVQNRDRDATACRCNCRAACARNCALVPMTAMRLILARSSGSRPSFFSSTMDSSRDFQRQRLVFGRVVFGDGNLRIGNHRRRIKQARAGIGRRARGAARRQFPFPMIKPRLSTARTRRVVIRAAAEIAAGLDGAARRLPRAWRRICGCAKMS